MEKPNDQPLTKDTRALAPGNNFTAEAPESVSEPAWPDPPSEQLAKLEALLPGIIEEASYNEVYGIELDPSRKFQSRLVLQKFIRGNLNDVQRAKEQLLATLKWRKEVQPWQLKDEAFSKQRFGGLGYVTTLEGVPGSPNKKDVATFNIYGAVKDNKLTFEDLDGFIRWRVGLMELGISRLCLSSATRPIPNYGEGPDPYQGIQVHDHLNVSFLRMDPCAKAASKRTIELFQKYYPETLSRKFFVNVPVVMGWMFQAMRPFLAKETVKKFTVLSYGNQLANELGMGVPEVYGGKGGALETVGETLKME